MASLTQENVRAAGFESFNGMSREALFNGDGSEGSPKPAIRVFGPASTFAQNLEPKYITVSRDSKTAWVTLQKANAIVTIDIPTATVTRLAGLGTVDDSLADNGFDSSNALDASDRDLLINIHNWPVYGLFLSDTIASYSVGAKTYLVMANEGDSRDWSGYSEEARIGGVTIDSDVFPNAADLKKNANLGRLKITTAQGDTDGDGAYEELYSFVTRSFSIRDAADNLIWDSGDRFEQITAAANPAFFNSNHEINKLDDRSDDKGSEPEALAVGNAFGRTYAIIGLERVGGVMVFAVTVHT